MISRLVDKAKYECARTWGRVSARLPEHDLKKRVDERMSMARLYREDITVWRVHEARRKGARVGEGCRFFSLNMFSEPYLITIGDNVLVSGNVVFLTHDASVRLWRREDPKLWATFGTIEVGDNCFIGMNALINRNVKIGRNCIVGAGAVVREHVPDDSVVAGNPAKVIFKTSMAKKLLLSSRDTVRADFSCDEEKRAFLERYYRVGSSSTVRARKN